MKGLLNEAVRASVNASELEKVAAHKAALPLCHTAGGEFAYNGYLLLLAKGGRTTEANILEASRRLAAANERHFSELRERSNGREAA